MRHFVQTKKSHLCHWAYIYTHIPPMPHAAMQNVNIILIMRKVLALFVLTHWYYWSSDTMYYYIAAILSNKLDELLRAAQILAVIHSFKIIFNFFNIFSWLYGSLLYLRVMTSVTLFDNLGLHWTVIPNQWFN